MKFLANENFPHPSIDLIRNSGYHVISIAETNAGISDHVVIEISLQNNLIILTFDKDYGEIIFKEKILIPPSIVFFRFKGNDSRFAGNVICKLLKDNVELNHHFTVVEESGIRQRAY